MDQCDAQRESLPPARGKILCQRIAMLLETDQLEGIEDAVFVGDAIHAAVKGQILQSRQIIIDRKFLRHVSNTQTDFLTLLENVISKNCRLAFTGDQQAE